MGVLDSRESTVKLRWYTVVIDCLDPHAQARWWAGALDGQIVYEADDEVVVIPGGLPEGYDHTVPIPAEQWHRQQPGLVFVTVPEGKEVKNRLHLDLAPHTEDDREAQIRRLLDSGATRVDVGQDEQQVGWTVLADPEGNEFCILDG